jgi:hypothetical protein
MNNFIKQVIEEKFASKAQQRYFYAQAGKGGKKGKKWAKWAKEFSDDTDFEKIPEKVDEENDEKILDKNQESKDEELDEFVDKDGNVMTSKLPSNYRSKGITQNNTTDEVVKSAYSSMGTHGVHGTHTSLRYWAENREQLKNLIETQIDEIDMSDALGYDETLGDDKSYDEAEKFFKDELDLSDDETEERLEKLGYDEKLKDDKVRLVEKDKNYIEEFIESVLSKKTNDNEFVNNKTHELKEVNPIIKRQIKSLKDTLENNNLTVEDIIEYLKSYE